MNHSAMLIDLLTGLSRRARLVGFVRGAVTVAVVALVAVELAWALRWPLGLIGLATAAVGLGVSAWRAHHQMPSPAQVARRADTTLHLKDLLITAYERRNATDTVSRAVVASAHAAVSSASASAIYPFEGPRAIRLLAIGTGLAQVVVLMLVWQAPDAGAPLNTLAALSLPGGGNDAGSPAAIASTPKAVGGSSAGGSPASNEVRASATRPASAMPADAKTTVDASGGNDAAATADNLSGRSPRDAVTGAMRESLAARDAEQLRQATQNARTPQTQGRVPIAMRGLVERYFASLHAFRERQR